MDSDISSFGKWRQRLWPLHSYELKKIVPLLLLKFLVSLNFSILSCTKETVVVTASNSGAEVISVLKGWIVLPIALLIAVLYAKLTNLLKASTLFYSCIFFFLGFYLLYGFVIYPNIDVLTPLQSAENFRNFIGAGHSHWIAIYQNWFHTLFFVVSELWSTIVIFMLFWGFANSITRVGEAKRTYTLFIAAGDVGAILTGPIVTYFCRKYELFDFGLTVKALMLIIATVCLAIVAVYWWMQKYVLTDKRFYNPDIMGNQIKQKTKLSLFQSLKHIGKSKYLLSVAILVIGCALTINMVEVSWKAHLKLLFPVNAEYQIFYSKILSSIGFFALITVLLFGGSSLRVFGWRFSAQITPVAIGITGLCFFLLCLGKEHIGGVTGLIGLSPLMFVALFGAFQNVLSKVVKYSFFDSTKEMVFIPLDQESKTKGKAAIDVVGSRFGKSGSSWIQIALIDLIGTGSVLSITSYLIPIIALTVVGWMFAVRYLAKEFEAQDRSLSLSS